MPDAGGHISNTSKESLYDFVDRHQKIDESIEEAQYTVRALKKQKKELRAVIAGAGFILDVFDETLQKMQMSFEEREAYDRELRRNMAWMGMPLGTQAEMFKEEETAVPPDVQVERVRDAGTTAGRLGRERSANPWSPGREAAAQDVVDKPKRGRPKKDASADPGQTERPAPQLRRGRKAKEAAP